MEVDTSAAGEVVAGLAVGEVERGVAVVVVVAAAAADTSMPFHRASPSQTHPTLSLCHSDSLLSEAMVMAQEAVQCIPAQGSAPATLVVD